MILQKVKILLPDEVKSDTGKHPFCAHGTRVFIDDKEIYNLTDITINFPVHGVTKVTLDILITGGSEVEFDGFAEVEINEKRAV